VSKIPEWKHLKVNRADGVTEVFQHTNDGPLIWTPSVGRELTELLTWVATDGDTKVVILTGTGNEYCAKIGGAEFKTMTWRQIWSMELRLLNSMVDLNTIVIAAVNGPVRIHSELPVLADIVLACPEAEFSDPYHFTRNVVPGDGVQLVWGTLLGSSRANYFLLTGERIGADEAKRLGAVHEILPREELLTRAHELARGLAERPAAVLTYSKAALRIRDRRNFREDLSHSLSLEGLGLHALGYHRPE
jgi:enoyl-CoA hydratase/carnithine racemase